MGAPGGVMTTEFDFVHSITENLVVTAFGWNIRSHFLFISSIDNHQMAGQARLCSYWVRPLVR